MYKLIFILLILVTTTGLSQEYFSLLDKTNFTDSEKKELLTLFQDAEKEKIHLNLLLNKFKEGLAKKVNFITIYNVLKRRISYIKEIEQYLTSWHYKGFKIKNKEYILQVLLELTERGINKEVYERIFSAGYTKKKSLDETVKYCDLILKYYSDPIPVDSLTDIIVSCIENDISPKKSELFLYIFIDAQRNNLPVEMTKNLIIDGISQRRFIEDIKREIKIEHSGQKRPSEEIYIKRKNEIEKYKEFKNFQQERRGKY